MRHDVAAVQRSEVLSGPAVQAEAAGKVAMGALTGAYEATRFKNKPPKAHLESLAVLGAGGGAEAAIKRAAALARGNILARCG